MTFTAPQSPTWHYQIAYFVQATVQTPKRFSLQWHKNNNPCVREAVTSNCLMSPPANYFLSKQSLINFLSVESLSYVELAVCVVLIIPAQETARLYFCLSESKMSPGKWWNITGWVNVRGFELVSNKHVHTHPHPPTPTHTQNERGSMRWWYRELKRATSETEGDLETKRRRQGELTQAVLTGGLRPRTVSKPCRSLQGGCGPLVRHNYWHTARLLRMETLRGAGAEALLPTGGQEEAGSMTLCIEPWHRQQKH